MPEDGWMNECYECGGGFEDGESVKIVGNATVHVEGEQEIIQMEDYTYFHEDCWRERHA